MNLKIIVLFAALLMSFISLPATAVPTTWSTTGDLNTGRESPTINLLNNGQVLVAGGSNLGGGLSSAELYNPATGLWTYTGSLPGTRTSDTATLLPNGQVLVAGGMDSTFNWVTSAELYNPGTGLWSTTGSMNNAREGHTATLLNNGTVLIAGGENADGDITSAEIYDPTTGVWTSTGSLNIARTGHTATLLSNGQVLVAGGSTGVETLLSSAELYNPSTGVWTVTGTMSQGRAGHTATLLASGQVLVAGGGNVNTTGLGSSQLYTVSTGKWTNTGEMVTPRNSHTATLLQNGKVLVAGGIDYTNTFLSSAEIFNPATATWSSTTSLNVEHYDHVSTLLNNGLALVAGGGFINSGYPTDSELYNSGETPQTITFNAIANQTDPTASFALIANASSGLSVTFSVVSGPATITGSTITLTGSGTVVVQASQAGNATYLADTSPPQSFTVSQATQTINFPAIADQTVGAAPFALNATATSGLAVGYSLVSGPATLSGTNDNTVTVTGLGTVIIQASQAGNTNYLAATSVNQSFTVNQASQTINFPAIANQPYPDPGSPFVLNATATSGLAVGYSYVSGPATLSGTNNDTVTVTGTGTVVIRASQAGNGNYLAATSVNQSFTVAAPVSFTGNPTATPFNDGVPGLLKYFYHINPAGPMTAADYAALPAAGTTTIGSTQYLTLTYRQYALGTGMAIYVQTSPDLQTWTTLTPTATTPTATTFALQQVNTDPTTGDPIFQVQTTINGGRQFLRLNVTQP